MKSIARLGLASLALGVMPLPSTASQGIYERCISSGHHRLVCLDLDLMVDLIELSDLSEHPIGTSSITLNNDVWIKANQALGRHDNQHCVMAMNPVAVLSGSVADRRVTLQVDCDSGQTGALVFANYDPRALTIVTPKVTIYESGVAPPAILSLGASTSTIAVVVQRGGTEGTRGAVEPLTAMVVTTLSPSPAAFTITTSGKQMLTFSPTLTIRIEEGEEAPDEIAPPQPPTEPSPPVVVAPPPKVTTTPPEPSIIASLADLLKKVKWKTDKGRDRGDIPIEETAGLGEALARLFRAEGLCDDRITASQISETASVNLEVFWTCEINGGDVSYIATIKRTGELVENGTTSPTPIPKPSPTATLKELLALYRWEDSISARSVEGLYEALVKLFRDEGMCEGRITIFSLEEAKLSLGEAKSPRNADVFWSCEINGVDVTHETKIRKTGELIDRGVGAGGAVASADAGIDHFHRNPIDEYNARVVKGLVPLEQGHRYWFEKRPDGRIHLTYSLTPSEAAELVARGVQIVLLGVGGATDRALMAQVVQMAHAIQTTPAPEPTRAVVAPTPAQVDLNDRVNTAFNSLSPEDQAAFHKELAETPDAGKLALFTKLAAGEWPPVKKTLRELLTGMSGWVTISDDDLVDRIKDELVEHQKCLDGAGIILTDSGHRTQRAKIYVERSQIYVYMKCTSFSEPQYGMLNFHTTLDY